MKKLIILTIFFLPSCYQKRIAQLEKNQKTIVQAVNVIGGKILEKETKEQVKK